MPMDTDGARGDGFTRVGRLGDFPEGRGRKVTVADEEIAVWNVGGTVYAVSNVCSHQHISALHEGTLGGLTLTCPMHGWSYSLETGKAVSGQGAIRRFDVRIEKGEVFVQVPPSRW